MISIFHKLLAPKKSLAYTELIKLRNYKVLEGALEKRIMTDLENLIWEMIDHEERYHTLFKSQRNSGKELTDNENLILSFFQRDSVHETLEIFAGIKKVTGKDIAREAIYAKTAMDSVEYRTRSKKQ